MALVVENIWIDPPDDSPEPTADGILVATSQGMIHTIKIVRKDPEAGKSKPLFYGETILTIVMGHDAAKELSAYLR